MDKFSKIELLAYIKKFNKKNENKIINIDKLKKKELYDICLNYNLLSISHDNNDIVINYKNVSKDHILQNIELYFLKQNLTNQWCSCGPAVCCLICPIVICPSAARPARSR